MRILGIDFGSKRIGVAMSDETGRFAFPHSVVSNGPSAVSTILRIARENNVEKIVVGESLDYKGKPNLIMPAITRFAESLKTEGSLAVVFEKEFLSTAEASRLQGEGKDIDASAAAIILKSYLDKQP